MSAQRTAARRRAGVRVRRQRCEGASPMRRSARRRRSAHRMKARRGQGRHAGAARCGERSKRFWRAVPPAKQRYGCAARALTRRADAAHAPFSAGAVAMASPTPVATLRLPDGREVCLPVLIDASGALFVDVRRLQPDTGAPSLREAARLLTRHAQVSVPSTRGSAAPPRARPRCAPRRAQPRCSTGRPSRGLTRAAARLR